MRDYFGSLFGARAVPGRVLAQDGVRGMFCVRGYELQGWVNSHEAKRHPKLWVEARIKIEAQIARRSLRGVDVDQISAYLETMAGELSLSHSRMT